MLKVKDVVAAVDRIAPPALALPDDPIGLHAGSLSSPVKRIAVALDASFGAIAKTSAKAVDMLVVHHPRFYKGLATVAENDPSGRRAAAIVRRGLAVYSAHTNLDLAPGGVNDVLASVAGIADPVPIKTEIRERLLKLAVFVPASHTEKVRQAICDAGAGAIGKYSACTFRTRGTGTFKGGKDADPFIGKPGVLEEADEHRLETVFGEFSANRVLAAMLRVHPYEEVAYDLYPLLGWAGLYGFGRVGGLARAETLSGLAKRMAMATGSHMTQFAGKAGMKVKRLAVWGGGGVDVKAVLSCGPDAVVAGEASYHDVEMFADDGVGVVTLGHAHSEEIVLKPLAERLRRELPGAAIEVFPHAGPEMRNAP